MKISDLIRTLEVIKSKHGDLHVFRYASPSEAMKDCHPEIHNVYLEHHKETPQMFGHPKVVELK